MQYYATIQELIDSVKDLEISYRKLHENIYIKNNDTVIAVPYSSLIRNYLPFFKETEVYTGFSPRELTLYRYKPKKLSYDLYGNTELWSSLLELNGMYSIIDFNLDKTIKVFEPKTFLTLLNEVMILEGLID